MSIISIHASAKEATKRLLEVRKCLFYFNPRLREGGDGAIRGAIKDVTSISIHASAKEATPAKLLPVLPVVFQSTPPRRRRQRRCIQMGLDKVISIHASAKEATATYCDTSAIMYISSLNNFFVHFF